MTSSISRRRIRTGTWAVWLATAALGLAACQNVPHPRHENADPDQRLAAALARYDMTQSYGQNNGTLLSDQRVIVDSGGARLAIEELSLEYPNHVPTLLMCADLCFQAGEREKATAYADRVLNLQPSNNFAAILRARTAIQDGSLSKAREVLESQVRLTPQSPYVHEMLASVHFLGGDLASCERELAEADRLGGDAPRIAYNKGLVAERRGDKAGARSQYERALQLQPGYPEAESRLAAIVGAAPAK